MRQIHPQQHKTIQHKTMSSTTITTTHNNDGTITTTIITTTTNVVERNVVEREMTDEEKNDYQRARDAELELPEWIDFPQWFNEQNYPQNVSFNQVLDDAEDSYGPDFHDEEWKESYDEFYQLWKNYTHN